MAAKFSDLKGVEAVLALFLGAILFLFLMTVGFGLTLAISAAGIWAANTIAGHVVLALTWVNVFAVAAVLWIVKFVLARK